MTPALPVAAMTALALLQTIGGYPRSIILGLLALLVLPVITILFVSHLVDIQTIDEHRLRQVEETVAELSREIDVDADASASAAGPGGGSERGSSGGSSSGIDAGSAGPVDRETPIGERADDGSVASADSDVSADSHDSARSEGETDGEAGS